MVIIVHKYQKEKRDKKTDCLKYRKTKTKFEHNYQKAAFYKAFLLVKAYEGDGKND